MAFPVEVLSPLCLQKASPAGTTERLPIPESLPIPGALLCFLRSTETPEAGFPAPRARRGCVTSPRARKEAGSGRPRSGTRKPTFLTRVNSSRSGGSGPCLTGLAAEGMRARAHPPAKPSFTASLGSWGGGGVPPGTDLTAPTRSTSPQSPEAHSHISKRAPGRSARSLTKPGEQPRRRRTC